MLRGGISGSPYLFIKVFKYRCHTRIMQIQKTGVQIIRATPKHLKYVQRLNKMLFEKEQREYDKTLNLQWTFGKAGTAYYKKHITAEDCSVFIALVDNKIVGYLCGGIIKDHSYRKSPRAAELDNMFVLDKYRSQGVGTALHKAFVAWCKTMNVKMLRVVTSAKNAGAINFYHKKGFKDYSLVLESNI